MAEIKVDSDRNKDALLTTVQSAEGSSDEEMHEHDSSLTVNERTQEPIDTPLKNCPHGDAPHSHTNTRTVDDGEKDSEQGEKKEDANTDSTAIGPSGDSLSSKEKKREDDTGLTKTGLTMADPTGDFLSSSKSKREHETNQDIKETPPDIKQHGDGSLSEPNSNNEVGRKTENEHEKKKQDTEKTEESPDRLPDSKQHSDILPSEPTTGTEEDKKKNSEHRESKEDTGLTKTGLTMADPTGDFLSSSKSKREHETNQDIKETPPDIKQHGDGSLSEPNSNTEVGGKTKKQDTEKTEESPDRLPDSKQHSDILPSEPTTGTEEDKKKNSEHREKPLKDTAASGLQEKQTQRTVPKNDKPLWIYATFGALLLSVVCAVLHQYNLDLTPPVQKEFDVVDVFNKEMEKVKSSFPNQRSELWRRSLIHLRRHLKSAHHTEPVSLILTSGYGAERTLGCLAQRLAKAFSTALNSSYQEINGKGTASQDSDQVKLEVDSELREAFEKNKKAAVIHRFEEFPPGSTLIFYRYCDHENAAYKNVFLAFTVMLDAELEVLADACLGKVEDMVHEQIKQRFISSDKSALFNQMDVDKLSGLWSRISHLILPVAAEEKIEQQGCAERLKGESL
ncbi:torsin-1A-interacting protein 2-like isoform X3 [Myxocyprinus asiaticus]|uniref:torsin-1A-interacting protein 2-like isoform X3 n=1 Tax=Myxocyprinus asiaticus TaxID=70543 RepID=UPI00222245BE|nr:torsin-1A-interacting protein 2-like isoform X3 [Myxocyprinus asiaticus]